MRGISVAACLTLAHVVAAQQIFDTWTTTWQQGSAFVYKNAGNSPVNFVNPGASADATVNVDDGKVFQPISAGFGGSLTDSSATVLANLKKKNSGNYWKVINTMFNTNDNMTSSAGFTFVRVPLGASDFSASDYSFDSTQGDTSLAKFNRNSAPGDVISVLKDIMTVNKIMKVQLLPWSAPAWMKDGNNMHGGSLVNSNIKPYAQYIYKGVQAFHDNGIPIYMVGIQNEPEHSDPSYPSTTMPSDVMGQVGNELRSLLDKDGSLKGVKIIGYEHNWDHATAYASDLMNKYNSAFAGVAFHCYGGKKEQQSDFQKAHPNKEIYFTECSGTMGSDYWQDVKWATDSVVIGAVENYAQSAAYWNLALDDKGKPMLPGTGSCKGGCRGMVTVKADGTFSFNQEFYTLAQGSKAVIPKDAGGPIGQRISSSISGSGLRATAFQTTRTNKSDWNRYSLTVLNWNDGNSNWNPQPVKANINFRGKQAPYTFPVGVTTLTWYATPK